jgi:hypothetical protein
MNYVYRVAFSWRGFQPQMKWSDAWVPLNAGGYWSKDKPQWVGLFAALQAIWAAKAINKLQLS